MGRTTRNQTVQFHSETIVCQCGFFLAAGFDNCAHHPAMAIGHGSSVARAGLVGEGRLFAETGDIATTINYRHFGTSVGEAKQMMSIPIGQLDCCKPDGRAKTIAAPVAFFDTHLES